MDFWDKIKKDLQKGVEEGITFVKEGAAIVQKKAEELTEEGKKRYRLYELKSRVHKEVAELGGKVYDLSSKVKNPMLDARVKVIKNRIVRLHSEIMKIEGKIEASKKGSVSVKKTVKKPSERKRSAAKR